MLAEITQSAKAQDHVLVHTGLRMKLTFPISFLALVLIPVEYWSFYFLLDEHYGLQRYTKLAIIN